jgi:PPOX class probable F420-dependent enzyme
MNVLPRPTRRALVLANKKFFEALRSAQSAAVSDMPVRDGGFRELAGHKHCLVVTYRKDGHAIAQPVWPAYQGDRVYIWTEEHAMKVKRLRRNPNALIAPSSFRGRPLGNPIEATARILDDPAERHQAAAIFRSQMGLETQGIRRGLPPTHGCCLDRANAEDASMNRRHPTIGLVAKGPRA